MLQLGSEGPLLLTARCPELVGAGWLLTPGAAAGPGCWELCVAPPVFTPYLRPGSPETVWEVGRRRKASGPVSSVYNKSIYTQAFIIAVQDADLVV